MPSRSFVVKLADLERGAKEISAPLSEAWLKDALANTDAEPVGDGSVAVELLKNGREVLVRGRAKAKVTAPCVVTLEPLPFELEAEIFLMLRPAPEKDAKRPKAGGNEKAPAAPEKPKKKKRVREEEEPELSSEAAAEDVYEGEEVVLDEFLREFIVLEIPAYPRRSDLPSPEESLSSRPLADPPDEKPIDPRLLPLLGLRDRLRS